MSNVVFWCFSHAFPKPDKAGATKDIHLQTLRHSFATDLCRETSKIRLVQEVLGKHSWSSSTNSHCRSVSLPPALVILSGWLGLPCQKATTHSWHPVPLAQAHLHHIAHVPPPFQEATSSCGFKKACEV